MDFLGFVQFEQYLQDMHMQYYIKILVFCCANSSA